MLSFLQKYLVHFVLPFSVYWGHRAVWWELAGYDHTQYLDTYNVVFPFHISAVKLGIYLSGMQSNNEQSSRICKTRTSSKFQWIKGQANLNNFTLFTFFKITKIWLTKSSLWFNSCLNSVNTSKVYSNICKFDITYEV